MTRAEGLIDTLLSVCHKDRVLNKEVPLGLRARAWQFPTGTEQQVNTRPAVVSTRSRNADEYKQHARQWYSQSLTTGGRMPEVGANEGAWRCIS